MNYLPKNFQHNILIAALIAPLFVLPASVCAYDNIPFGPSAIFNTTCARCHEGECSGRMSFHLPEKAANQHIRRHGGELSPENIRQLFKLLRYMKEECSFYPTTFALMNDQTWEREMLNKFRSPSKQAYFMPLGLLEPGVYQLIFKEFNTTNSCVEIINDEFDFIDNESLTGGHGEKNCNFI